MAHRSTDKKKVGPVIEAINLGYQIQGQQLLQHVDVEIKPTEMWAILGPNGAGKSTLLKCLTGALTPTTGVVTFHRKPLARYLPRELAQKRAVCSQLRMMDFSFTALEMVLMGRSPHRSGRSKGRDLEIAEQTLTKMDAWHLRDRLFPTLSGGEQQRVHLARTLAQVWEQKEGALFLDEPTSALDLKHQHQTLGLVRNFAQTTKSAVAVILHDLHLALQYCSHAFLLKKGRVFAKGVVVDVICRDAVEDVFDLKGISWENGSETRLNGATLKTLEI